MAVVDSEIKRQAIASRLTIIDNNHPNVNIGAHIGLCKMGTWQWLGGRNISAIGEERKCGGLVKDSLDWKLYPLSCHYGVSFLCETNERK